MQGWGMQFEERGGGTGGGKGTWLKLANDGDTSVVAFLGEPYGREVVFEGNRYVVFTDAHKRQGLEPNVRLAVNVGVLATKEVKVYEMGLGTFKDVVALKHKFGLTGWAYELKRTGKPKDPKTRYSVLPDRQLTDDEKAWLAAAQLVDLVKLYETPPNTRDADAGAAPVAPAVATDAARLLGRLAPDEQRRFMARFGIKSLAELPAELADKAMAYLRQVDGATAEPTLFINDVEVSALSVELKKLPPAQVAEWLKHCGVQRVRELPTARLAAGKEFLALLMKEYGPAAGSTPVDPFA